MAFASCIGSCDIPILPCSDEAVTECSSISSDDDNESACDTKIIDEKESNVSAEDIFSSSDNLFDANQFPLLNSLGVKKEFQLDALVREIVKYKGSTINFIQNNNRLGFLLLCPSSRTTEICSAELRWKGGAIDSLLTIIRESTKCNEREAAKCVIKTLLKKQEEAFTSVALAQGLITDDKKMDAIQIEAMLSEAGLCSNNNARILFRHLNHFFGKGKFKSEHKRRAFFAGSDFPPVIDRLVLPD
jgi:hypothetical protein